MAGPVEQFGGNHAVRATVYVIKLQGAADRWAHANSLPVVVLGPEPVGTIPCRRIQSSHSGSSSARNFSRFSGCQSLRKRSEEHTSELQSLMRISYAVFCLKKKTK